MPILKREDREVALGWLKPNPRNVATHSRRQLDKLKRVVERIGYTTPVICDENGTLIAGHARLTVARETGRSHLPAVVLSGLSEAEKRSLMLADNRLARDTGTDRAKLFDELADLQVLLAEDGLDLEVTGYETPEIDQLAVDFEARRDEAADALDPGWEDRPVVARPNDLFQLAGHRLLCGSCLDEGAVERLMDGQRAAAVIGDPPYNLRVASLVGRGRSKHPEFAMASGEMSRDDFATFLTSAFTAAARVSTPGALHYWFMDWRHVGELVSAGRTTYDTMLNLIIWVKSNAGMGSLYRSQHELCGVFRTAGGPHRNNVELGRYERNRTNVWRYAGANAFRSGRLDDLRDHPTVKPVAMLADAIKDCTRRGDLVLDPFAGSGSTLLAADRTGRQGYGVEVEPRYVDVTLRRLEAVTGRDAIHVESGLTWHQLAAERGIDPEPARGRPRQRRTRS